MDSNQFDTLVKSFSRTDTRRALLRRLAPLPLAGLLATLLHDESAAGGRHQRRSKRNNGQSGDDKDNRTGKRTDNRKGKRKGKTRGTPASAGCTPTTCAAQGTTCGSIADGCGGALNCGPCDGATPFCDGGTCTCVPKFAACPYGPDGYRPEACCPDPDDPGVVQCWVHVDCLPDGPSPCC